MTQRPEETPLQRAQKHARADLPKRFYERAEVSEDDNGFALTLDGRPVRTPGRHQIIVPAIVIAEAMAAEWNAQKDIIDPATMPMTRLVNSTIEGVVEHRGAVAEDIGNFLRSDMVCYRADTPEGLVAAQEAAWDPLVAYMKDRHALRLNLVVGVMPIDQDNARINAISNDLAERDAFTLAALHTATTLSGSAVVALALFDGTLNADDAWRAAHVDEDWQISLWGEDAEAKALRSQKRTSFNAAACVLEALRKE